MRVQKVVVITAWLLGGAVPTAAQQAGWSYPSGPRANPLAPPTELYSAQSAPRLSVGTIFFKPEDPAASVAVLRLTGSEGTLERRLVRAGDRMGDYQIEKVAEDGVWVKHRFLGTERRMRVSNVVSRQEDNAGGL